MNDLKYSERQTHSPETLTDLNPQELLQRIHAAETQIFSRLQEMRISSIDLVEGQAIQDALDGLVRLTKETLEFADSLVEVTRIAGSVWAEVCEKPRLYWSADAHPVPRVASGRPIEFALTTPLMVVSSDRRGSEYVLQAI